MRKARAVNAHGIISADRSPCIRLQMMISVVKSHTNRLDGRYVPKVVRAGTERRLRSISGQRTWDRER